MKIKLLGVILGFSLLSSSYCIYAQSALPPQNTSTDVRAIQYSPICSKTIINNTLTTVVEPSTHRPIPSFGSIILNINCKSLPAPPTTTASQSNITPTANFSQTTFYVTKSGHTVNYRYNPNGSVVMTVSGSITNPNSIACTGCSGSAGAGAVVNSSNILSIAHSPIAITNSTAQFSDCDATGSCLCVPCPIQSIR